MDPGLQTRRSRRLDSPHTYTQPACPRPLKYVTSSSLSSKSRHFRLSRQNTLFCFAIPGMVYLAQFLQTAVAGGTGSRASESSLGSHEPPFCPGGIDHYAGTLACASARRFAASILGLHQFAGVQSAISACTVFCTCATTSAPASTFAAVSLTLCARARACHQGPWHPARAQTASSSARNHDSAPRTCAVPRRLLNHAAAWRHRSADDQDQRLHATQSA